jgi:hypothetical protein
MTRFVVCSAILSLFSLLALGQREGSEAAQPAHAPIYRVTVEERTIHAINYGHRNEPTRIDFRGTVLLPAAKGEARVESKAGAVEVDSKFEDLEPPTRFGPEYLTYVLWAITPDGRPVNLGEILTDGSNKAKLKVTTQLQAFGLIVTAEPYFAVTQPSSIVVLENVLRSDTRGKVEDVEARYELLPRSQYPAASKIVQIQQSPANGAKKIPLDQYEAVLALYQAQNALQIARAEGADQYAAGTLQKAEQLYQQAQKLQADKSESKRVVTIAREAAQVAGDARSIALTHKEKR